MIARRQIAELDETDLRILDVIQRHPPIPTAELAQKVGLSQSPCWRRVSRLKDEGFFEDRQVHLNAAKAGFATTIFAQVKLSAHGRANLIEFYEAIQRFPEVLECHTIMGAFDFLLRIVTRDIEDYRMFVFGRLSTLPAVQEIQSTISMATNKSTSVLPLRNR